MRTETRRTVTVIATFIGLAAAGRSSSALAGPVTIKGSDTMVVLGQRWAEEFMKKNPKTTIQVTGGGSGTGISALINGTTDICEASRAMKDAEKKQLADKAGAPPVETAVARDGLSVYVNDSNPINELTMAVQVALGTFELSACRAIDANDDGIVLGFEGIFHSGPFESVRVINQRYRGFDSQCKSGRTRNGFKSRPRVRHFLDFSSA